MRTLLFILLALMNCSPASPLVPMWDAQSQINAAADYKVRDCKKKCVDEAKGDQSKLAGCVDTPPSPPLLIFTDQNERNLNLCAISILRTDCPFTGYPIMCLGVYMDDPIGEIPWYVNFNETAKKKLK